MISLLYVDDEPVLLDLCRTFLEREGDITVTPASSAKDALKSLAAGKYDAIVSDYQMPDTDGIMFLRTVRSQFPDIPFILFTGRGREEVVIEAINSGADSYVQKGGEPKAQFKELSHLIHQVVRRRKAESELRLMKFSVDHASEGILWMRTNGAITYYNDSVSLMLGYTPREFSRLSMRDIRPGFSPASFFGSPDGAGTISGTTREEILKKKDGTLIPVELVLNSTGEGAEAQVFAFIRDISERKKSEHDLKKAVRQLMTTEDELRQQFTDLKKSDQNLQEIQQRYLMLFEESRDWIWEADCTGTITRSNSEVQELLGYTRDEVAGKSFFEVTTSGNCPGGPAELMDRFSRREAFRALPLQVIGQDGTNRLLELTGFPVYARDGSCTGFHGIARSRTDPLGRERNLRPEPLAGYRGLIEKAGDAIFVFEEESGCLIDANQRALEMVKRDLSEISGLTEADLHPTGESRADRILHGDGNASEVFEDILVDREGTRIPVVASTKRIASGTRSLRVGIFHNISDLCAIQETLKETSGELDRFFTTGPDLFCILDTEGKILRLNPAGEHILGSRQAAGSLIECIEPEDRAATRTLLRQAGRNGRAVSFENRIRYPDGTTRWLEWRAFVSGRKQIYAVARDRTEQRQVELALAEATKKLNLLGDLTRHDIRNKLVVLTGYLDLFRNHPAEPYFSMYAEKIRETIATITAQIEFTKVYRNLGYEAPGWYSTKKLFCEACARFQVPPATICDDTGNWEIFADPLIVRVFDILADNVLKHAATFTAIRCTCQETPEGLLIVFEDNGVGIPQGDKERIFEREPGTGSLSSNLYLSREILSITGISIHETGLAGKGARFELLVPRSGYHTSQPSAPDDRENPAPQFIPSTHHIQSV